MSDYWEEATNQAVEAEKNEMLGNYELAFAMYKAAIVSLLGGAEENGDDNEHRLHIKERATEYLLRAELIFNNYLTCQKQLVTPNASFRVPWRSRVQLRRYKLVSVFDNILLVHDVADNLYVIIKGVLKSSNPIDRSETCILPADVPFMVKLFALHETDTTVYFVLEHVRYGKLWNHLEHYFAPHTDNFDTELTCVTTSQDNGSSCSGDDGSLNTSDSSRNDLSLSRLESSVYTDTLSCESLSSHEENYFDLIEDFARAKIQKLKEIQDFNERRQHLEILRPVKKTTSQVDLKILDDRWEQGRSHSLTNLNYEKQETIGVSDARLYRTRSECDENAENVRICDDEYSLYQNEKDGTESIPSADVDTQRLLMNAQKLIDSINETLARTEILPDHERNDTMYTRDCLSAFKVSSVVDSKKIKKQQLEYVEFETSLNRKNCETGDANVYQSQLPSSNPNTKDSCLCSPLSTMSYSIPSITEEYSVTTLLQKKGITKDLIKKWATEILIALDVLHQNGIICKDLNPDNILLSDNGSVRLTYFFRYPNVDRSVNMYARERLYVAPEVLTLHSNVTFASDWWSFGAILFELVTLQTLYSTHPGGIQSHTRINIPDNVPLETRTLLNELLRYDPNERLGAGLCGADDIKAHPFFSCTNWEDLT